MKLEIIVAIIALIGVIISIPLNYLIIEKFKAKNSLLEALAENKVNQFKMLWEICDFSNLKNDFVRLKKLIALNQWYKSGGGLVLSFKATQRFIWARNLVGGKSS